MTVSGDRWLAALLKDDQNHAPTPRGPAVIHIYQVIAGLAPSQRNRRRHRNQECIHTLTLTRSPLKSTSALITPRGGGA